VRVRMTRTRPAHGTTGPVTENRTFEVVIPAPTESEAMYRAVDFGRAVNITSDGAWQFALPVVADCIAVEPYEQEDLEDPW
jgi:hypothetical protein